MSVSGSLGGIANTWNKQFLEDFFFVSWNNSVVITTEEQAKAIWDSKAGVTTQYKDYPKWDDSYKSGYDVENGTLSMYEEYTSPIEQKRYIGLLAEPPVWHTHTEIVEGIQTTIVDNYLIPKEGYGEPSAESGYERNLISVTGVTAELKEFKKQVKSGTYRALKVLQTNFNYSFINKLKTYDIQSGQGTSESPYKRNTYLVNDKMIAFGENQGSTAWSLKCYAIFVSDGKTADEDQNKIIAWGYLKDDGSAVTVLGANRTDPPSQGEMPIFRIGNFKASFGALSEEIQ